MKNNLSLFILAITFSLPCFSQVGIGTNTPHASSKLEIASTNSGLLIPRMNSGQRTGIASPAKGLLVFDTDNSGFWYYNGTAWSQLSVGNNGWNLTGNAGTNLTSDFIGTTDAQPLRFRVNNTWAGEIHPTSGNVYFGLGSGQANTTGQANTAVGDHTLFANTEGNFNAANGYYALAANTTGFNNAAFGAYALTTNTTGHDNIAVGRNALFANTTGTFNTATGVGALLSNTVGFQNTASGFEALMSNTNGAGNTATGYWALHANTGGIFNTAMGQSTLRSNTTGEQNTGTGHSALSQNTTGSANTATGYSALEWNTTGIYNTATGDRAMKFNETGRDNTATGFAALYQNIGFQNTATGSGALMNNSGTNSHGNTATGFQALYNNLTGYENTADGSSALYNNTSGVENIAIGEGALYLNTTGNFNTAIGSLTLYNNVGGRSNIAIGAGAGTHQNTPDLFNTISIGNDDILNAYQNQVLIGNTNIGWIGGKVNWATYSDARIKNTVQEDVKGLAFVLKLRPVTYHVSSKAITAITGNKETPDYPGKYENDNVKYTGFIAQEVEQAAKEAGFEFSGCEAPKNKWSLYSLRYAEFVVPLVKATQEQQAMIDDLKAQLTLMKGEIEELKKKN